MPEPDLIELFVGPLASEGIRYLVSGSVAAMLYSEPRVTQLEFYREGGSEKHLRDIRAMLRLSGDQIDRPALTGWVVRKGVEAEWEIANSTR